MRQTPSRLTLVQVADDPPHLLAMLESMPKLKRLHLVDALPVMPQEFLSEGNISNRQITTIPHLSRLTIEALEDLSNNLWDVTYILGHLSLPSLRHIDVTCRFSHPHLCEVQPLLPVLAHHCHGPQDSGPIQALAIADLGHRYVAVMGWTESNIDGALLLQLMNDGHIVQDSARFCFRFNNRDHISSDEGSCARNLAATLAAFPLGHVTFLAVNDIIGRLRQASWWNGTHVLFPSLSRLFIKGSNVFRTFCYAFVMNKTIPAMSFDQGVPLAAHRFMRHPERREDFFDIPRTLQELIFPGLRTLSVVDVEFKTKDFADLFIEALVERRELGVGIQSLDITRSRFHRAFVERLREVVPVVTWDGEEVDVEVVTYPWMDVDSDGGEGSKYASEGGDSDVGDSDGEGGSEVGLGDSDSE